MRRAVAANEDSTETDRDTPVRLNVLENDECLTDTPVQIEISQMPGAGRIDTESAIGEVLYTPPAGFTGHDSFEYVVTDYSGTIDSASVGIRVNDRPEAVDDRATVDSGASISIDVIQNDSGLTDAPI